MSVRHGGGTAGRELAPWWHRRRWSRPGGGLAAHLLPGPAASTRPLPKNDPREPFLGTSLRGRVGCCVVVGGLNPKVRGYLGSVPAWELPRVLPDPPAAEFSGEIRQNGKCQSTVPAKGPGFLMKRVCESWERLSAETPTSSQKKKKKPQKNGQALSGLAIPSRLQQPRPCQTAGVESPGGHGEPGAARACLVLPNLLPREGKERQGLGWGKTT